MIVIGIGVLLFTRDEHVLLQERDECAPIHPNRIAPFGGGVEGKETVIACAKREIFEELQLDVQEADLQTLGLYETRNESGAYIHMFILQEVAESGLVLHEGKSIVKITIADAMANERVTDFTKRVLRDFERV